MKKYLIVARVGYSHLCSLDPVEAENAKQAFEIACKTRLPRLGLKRLGKLRTFYVIGEHSPQDNYGYSVDVYNDGWLENVGTHHKQELIQAIEPIKEQEVTE